MVQLKVRFLRRLPRLSCSPLNLLERVEYIVIFHLVFDCIALVPRTEILC